MKPVRLTRQEETIWLAALLEGEGCFSVIKASKTYRRPRLKVCLNMNDRDVVERAALFHPPAKVGHRPPRGHSKESWQVQWTSVRAESLMRRVLPYMGERRTLKIEECLACPDLSHFKESS